MKRTLILLLALLALSGCAGSGNGGFPPAKAARPAENPEITFTDDLGRELSLSPPQRVAAMIGSFAGIWAVAGGEDTLVAAANDAWTSFDLELEGAVNLGTTSSPNLELLLAAEPDLILASCNTASNLELLETFETAGLTAAYFDVESIDDYLRMLNVCAELTGCPENYETYGTAVKEQAEAAAARQDGSHPTVLYVRASGSSCKVKNSSGSVLGEMLADLGCSNVADRDGSLLETLSLEAVIAADPDYIFAVLQGADASKAQAVLEDTLLSHPAWSGLRAVREGRFYTLDNKLYNLKPNARWGEAYEKLADILYPE